MPAQDLTRHVPFCLCPNERPTTIPIQPPRFQRLGESGARCAGRSDCLQPRFGPSAREIRRFRRSPGRTSTLGCPASDRWSTSCCRSRGIAPRDAHRTLREAARRPEVHRLSPELSQRCAKNPSCRSDGSCDFAAELAGGLAHGRGQTPKSFGRNGSDRSLRWEQQVLDGCACPPEARASIPPAREVGAGGSGFADTLHDSFDVHLVISQP